MRYITTILLLFCANGLIYGQNTIVSYNFNVLQLYRQAGAPALDTAFVGGYVGYDGWDTSLVSRQEVNVLKAQLEMAYTQSARVNPYFTTLGSHLQNDEKVLYCWFRTDAGRYDSLRLLFKDATTSRAIYFLAGNQAWQQLTSDTTLTGYISATITQPGFYALFNPRAQSFEKKNYFPVLSRQIFYWINMQGQKKQQDRV